MKYNISDFISRSSDHAWQDTDLFLILEQLPAVTENGPWLAGGSIRRTITGQALESDIDFFFKDQDQFDTWCKAIVELGGTVKRTTEHHTTYEVALEIEDRPKGDSSYARNFRAGEFDAPVKHIVLLVQGIHFRYYENIEEVLDSFDFTICQLGFDGQFMHVGDYTLWDLARKRLALHKLTFGVSTVRRLLKYQTQDFKACSGCLTKILEAVSKDQNVIQSDVKYVD